MLDKYKLVIFDLDGTLYEGTEHFDFYAEHLMKKVNREKRAAFKDDYEKMKAGQHTVQIGKGYDMQRDVILTVDPMSLLVTDAQDWTGKAWSQEARESTYSDAVVFDFEKIIAIGDGWWLPFVTAKHYGVIDCYSSYLATKAYMVTDAFQLTPLPGLKEGLLFLKEKTNIVLLTNSDREDVQRLLKELHLTGVFEHIITSAKKPSRTKDLFEQLLSLYKANPKESVSIGDNFLNEIAPALSLGMNGIYITPVRETSYTDEKLTIVKSIINCF
ncbi:HAD family hydrolase [Halalkalibacterium ligniniphilum]|uniref:HAD family hydrolase n=1 Tax=Halalkalibacterium ligniniphilum TaxID=1134413 RepID=UPI000349CECB|nr:HAD family hydrolase [Halalkalibacterium ligniniphilum]